MAARRILSLWFPRLAAERVQRLRRDVVPAPLVVVGDVGGAQVLTSVSAEAEAVGLREGQGLRDATAIYPNLLTAPADPLNEARFLAVMRRWAGRFSPWVAEEAPAGLMIDLSGTAHLFGGEGAVLAQVFQDCADMGLTVRAGIADTPGAAWGLARYAQARMAPPLASGRSGDAIDQEARATRSRAAKRRGWERGGSPPQPAAAKGAEGAVISPPGRAREALVDLPLAALRLEAEAVDRLMRLGLRRVGDIMVIPRAALARRFGMQTLRRLDQAMGLEPEPVSPARPPMHFAVRLTFPDPIGLRSDVEAGLDRLLAPLCAQLRAKGRGVRRLAVQAFRADGGVAMVEVGLARAADSPDRLRPLIHLKLEQIDAGFGIDCLRLEALATEAVTAQQHRGQIDATQSAMAGAASGAASGVGQGAGQGAAHALDDLIGRLGARLGHEAITRLHPADSHVPAKAAQVLMAAWSVAHDGPWPAAPGPRPLLLMRPEPVDVSGPMEGRSDPPPRFRWRRREYAVRMAVGPERLQPEWWLEDPDWRSGARDYWRIEAEDGERLWLFFGQGGAVNDGWYCEGVFS
ncbi:DNA polymerase Y family protein [Tabrizicola piscis]|uniref:DNA polymerase Y family protein n=1 Tax=Tabrizicola piscis TaxID=2494374 RepID=A0A3S8UBB0_9RHOB|nr:DNA polymerase Y family protein [Tabrizicola piscis]AZL61002.1 DNA polymerase Y family protein [Tabrizicola piscis]